MQILLELLEIINLLSQKNDAINQEDKIYVIINSSQMAKL